MKKHTREELKKIAADVFSRYPTAKKVACTVDGQPFITDETDMYVKNYSRKNNSGRVLDIHEFTREGIEKKESDNSRGKEGKKSTGKGSKKAEKEKAPETDPGEKAGEGKQSPEVESKNEQS